MPHHFGQTPVLDYIRLLAIALWGGNALLGMRVVVQHRRKLARGRLVGWIGVCAVVVVMLETEWDRFGYALGTGARLMFVVIGGCCYAYSATQVLLGKS